MNNKIFIGGSISIQSINSLVKERLHNIIKKNHQVLIGDASGADKEAQRFFWEAGYSNVKVYCSGNNYRTNLGSWPIIRVDASDGVYGREFYTVKDKKMASDCTHGFMLWDGKSIGTATNIFTLVSHGKPTLVYFSPENKFYTIKDVNSFEALLGRCTKKDARQINKRLVLNLIEPVFIK